MQAQSGQSAPTNEVEGNETLSGTGTLTLTTNGGVDVWNYTGGLASATLSTTATITGGTTGGGVTMAIRFAMNTAPSTAFYGVFGVSQDTTMQNGPQVTALNPASSFRGRILNIASIGSVVWPTSLTTIVIRANCISTSSSDGGDMWITQGSRANNDPDYSSTQTNNFSTYVLDTWLWDSSDGSTDFDVADFMLWERELTDAECVAVADDIRGQLPLITNDPTPPFINVAVTG